MSWLRLLTVVVVVAASLWWGQASASARRAASSDPTVVRILAGGHLQVSSPDDAADIQVSGGPVFQVQDFAHEVVGVEPCVPLASLNIVTCPGRGLTSVTVLTGAGDDLVQTFTDLPVVIVTNGGDDDVRDGFSRDALVLLGDGDDEASSGTGPTNIFGNAGSDTVAYTTRSTGVAVRLDDAANDGAPGENDNVHSDVERILGSTAADVLIGNDVANQIFGLDGNDLIDGRGGPDVLDGGGGTDTVTYADHTGPVTATLDGNANDGQAGEQDNARNVENLIGGSGNDHLTGNAGANTLRGLAGSDRLSGLAGNDTLIGGAGTDTASGGTGTDTCQAEATISCP